MGKLVTLILRDANRTESLRALIRRDGGRAVSLPAFRFNTITDCAPAINFLRAPHKVHRLFFAGPHGILALRQIALANRLSLPTEMSCAAPGQASRKALLSAGFTNIIAPPSVGDFDSLMRRSLIGNLSGKRVALVQRLDAPPRAHDKLRQQKCIVTPLKCYERVPNTEDFWDRLDAKLRSEINCILAFDTPSLQLLLDSVGDDGERIRKLPLSVIHRNIEQKATQMGYENIIVTGHNAEMFESLRQMVGIKSDDNT